MEKVRFKEGYEAALQLSGRAFQARRMAKTKENNGTLLDASHGSCEVQTGICTPHPPGWCDFGGPALPLWAPSLHPQEARLS